MPQRVLNKKLLFLLLAVLTLVGVGAYFLHRAQVGRLSRQLLDRIALAEADGKTEQVLDLLKRYLFFMPGNTDALAQYARTLDQTAVTPADHLRAAQTLEQLVRKAPERKEDRRRLVTLLLEQEAYEAALPHLNALLHATPDDVSLLLLRAQCQEGKGDVVDAAASYGQILARAPGQLEASVRLAALLRRPLPDREPEEADEVLDRMVQHNATKARAWLERARARVSQKQLDLAEADLAAARKQADTGAAVLRASAELAQLRGQWDQARLFWRQGQKVYPTDVSFSLALARLESLQKRPREALRSIRQGLDKVPDDPDLLLALIDAQLTTADLEGAEKTLAQLRRHPDRSALADYLAGRLLMHRKRWPEALDQLKEALALAGSVLDAVIQSAMAECHEQLGERDRQLAAYEKAVTLDPSSVGARLGLALTAALLNRTERALELFRELEHLPQPPEGLWAPYGRALLREALALSADQRDWSELEERVLARAATVPEQAVELAVVRAEMLLARNRLAEAVAVLDTARKEHAGHADEVKLWVASIRLLAWQGNTEAARRLLAEARQKLGDRPELLGEVAETTVAGTKPDPALADVEQKLEALAPAERVRLLCRLAETAFEAGHKAEGERLWRRGLKERAEIPERVLLLDLALRVGNTTLIEAVLEELRRQEGGEGTWSRYGEAARELAVARTEARALENAARLLGEIRQRRPDWSRTVLLEAQLDELKGNSDRALEGYRKAFDLGERQPQLVQRLVQLLHGRGRDADADAVLRRFQQAGGALQGGFLRLAAEVALRAGNVERAVTLARQTLPQAGQDYRPYLWLGQFLLAAQRPVEAEEPLRTALALFDRTPEPWLALVTALVRNEKPAEAEKTLQQMTEHLSADDRDLALAGGYEILARPEEAHQHYQQALLRRPNEATVLHRASEFYLRMDKPGQAARLLQRLLDPDGPIDELRPWARRQLALLLAFRDDPKASEQAAALLEQNRKQGEENMAERRARALVRAAQPEKRQAALRELEELLKLAPATLPEHYRLVRLYEAEGNTTAARQQMLDLLARDGNNPVYLAHHIRNLLKDGEKDGIAVFLDRLERVEPNSERVKQFRKELAEEK